MLGRVHATLGSRWKAAAQYRAVTILDRSIAETYSALGDLFLIQPRMLFDQAIEAYSWAINLRPFYADAHVGLGDARVAKGTIDTAIAAYQKASTLDPFHARPLLRLGQIYAAAGRCGDALTAYARALEIDPGSTEAQAAAVSMSGGPCVPVGP